LLVNVSRIRFQDQKFDISHLTKYFHTKRADGDLAIYYELDPRERVETRGILEICPFSKRITQFREKPRPDETSSRNASVVFYFFRAETRAFINR
jgi:NDP-sugar pyrophosphorylase family protein